ncbi:hypothetical protein GCM10025789_19140 [Tessaracoccus lubricantis]|uniref:DUF2975 domain-containing protein n=1 Tax=Tessaracoccus lubricantis TaxID=545543 RepID=A0ABP9FEE4_9ACTN
MAKDRIKFDDSDFQLTKIVGAGVAVVTAIISVVIPIITWARGEPLDTEVSPEVAGQALAGAEPGVYLGHGREIQATFTDAGLGLWLASLAPAVLFVMILAVVVWLLWQLLDDVRGGHPFTLANVRRMRAIAMVIVGGSVLLFLAGGVSNGILSSAAVEGVDAMFIAGGDARDLLLPGVGFLIAGLAEAFRRGIELEQDVEGLV